MGWAYRSVSSYTTPVLSSTSSSHFLAFNTSLSTDSLVCNYYASNDNVQTTLTGLIEASADGVLWTTLKSLNNDLPKNAATLAEKRLSLCFRGEYQYVRFTLISKGATDPNVNINLISVKHSANVAGTSNPKANDENISIVGRRISVANNTEYKSLRISSIIGSTISNFSPVDSEINLGGIPSGLYLISAQKKNASPSCKTVIIK